MGRCAVGVDLGGTQIRAGVVSEEGELLSMHKALTRAERDAEAIFSDIAATARAAAEEGAGGLGGVAGVGVGSPAPLDLKRGVIVSPGNLPTLHGFPIVERLREALGTRVALNNDANCFGLAEARFGAGRGAEVCCALTLGTGLGCAIVLGGRIFDGPGGAAAEIWCSPYMGEIVEERVSGRGLARSYAELSGGSAAGPEIARRAEAGDARALEAFREFGCNLAVPAAYLCNIVDPDVLVLGGSIAKCFDLFIDALMAEADKYINEINRRRLRIVRSALGGDEAGVLGAAALVL